MSRYAHKVIDRRDAYYARAAIVIATDSLDFYTRAERGRVLQLSLFTDQQARQYEREQILDHAYPELQF